MNSLYLVPTPGKSIGIPLVSLTYLQRQAAALLWVKGSAVQIPLQRMTGPDKQTVFLSPPPGSVAWVLIRELGVDLWEAQRLSQFGFSAVLTVLKDCSKEASLLILAIALLLLTPEHPADVKPGQSADIALWATELGIFPTDMEPYLRLHGSTISRFMVGKLVPEN